MISQLQTFNINLTLIQYNWIMRTYITPVRLNIINQNIPDTCIKCSVDKSTLLQCMWNCLKERGGLPMNLTFSF